MTILKKLGYKVWVICGLALLLACVGLGGKKESAPIIDTVNATDTVETKVQEDPKDAIISFIFGEESSTYRGCGFSELEWGMSLAEVEKALPTYSLREEQSISDEEYQVYHHKRECYFTFLEDKLVAVRKDFPVRRGSPDILNSAIQTFGNFDATKQYFKTSYKTTSLQDRYWGGTERVFYNFGDTQVLVENTHQDGTDMKGKNIVVLYFMDTNLAKQLLEEYRVQTHDKLSWFLNIAANKNGQADNINVPEGNLGLSLKHFQYTPNQVRSYTPSPVIPKHAIDCWQFRPLEYPESTILTLEIEKSLTDKYADFPQGVVKGLFRPNSQVGRKKGLDTTHINMLYLKMTDLILNSLVSGVKGAMVSPPRDKLFIEYKNGEIVSSTPYRGMELDNDYVVELTHSNEIRFFKPMSVSVVN